MEDMEKPEEAPKPKMPVSWRSLLGMIVFIIAAISVSNYSGLTEHLFSVSSIPVRAMPVSTITKPVELVLPGAVEGANSAIITAEIPGQITEVSISEGQAVNPGQALIKIKGTAVNPVEMQRVQTETVAQPNPESIAAAQVQYDTLAQKYARYQILLEQGAVARREVDNLANRLEAARQALDEAKNSSVQPIFKNTSVPMTAQSGLHNLTTHVGGVVRNLAAKIGDTVQAGQQLLIVDNGSDVQVSVQLAQKDLYAVRSGTPVEIFLENHPEQITAGQVQSIFPQAGPAAGFFRTQIRLNNTGGLLKSGMTVKVRINTPNTVTVRAIPASALLHDQEDYIFLAVNGKAVRQPVTVGDKLGEFLEITSPLPDGVSIIMTGLTSLKNGADITLQ